MVFESIWRYSKFTFDPTLQSYDMPLFRKIIRNMFLNPMLKKKIETHITTFKFIFHISYFSIFYILYLYVIFTYPILYVRFRIVPAIQDGSFISMIFPMGTPLQWPHVSGPSCRTTPTWKKGWCDSPVDDGKSLNGYGHCPDATCAALSQGQC